MKRIGTNEIVEHLMTISDFAEYKLREFLSEFSANCGSVAMLGYSVKVCGIAWLRPRGGESLGSVGSYRISGESEIFSKEVAQSLEKEISDFLQESLFEGNRVIITGLFSAEVRNGRLYCSSSSILRGEVLNPTYVGADPIFKRKLISHFEEEATA